MVDKPKDNSLDSEIAKRLDYLFGEGENGSDDDLPIETDGKEVAANESPEEQPSAAESAISDIEELSAAQPDDESVPDDYPLAELKNLVLSIDWEITEETLAGLLSEIENLKNTYKSEKIISMFLQLLSSLGQYIKTNRGNAHPKTFKILNSVFTRLEEVVLTENISEADKKNLLRAEIQEYKRLRTTVSKRKAAEAGRKEVQAAAKVEPRARIVKYAEQAQLVAPADQTDEAVVAVTSESLAEVVRELKEFIHSELNALKQELKKLQKSD